MESPTIVVVRLSLGFFEPDCNRVYADWKVRENHIKITKSLESQGKSGNWKKGCICSGKVREIFSSKYLI